MYNEKEIFERCCIFAKQYFDLNFTEKVRLSPRMTKSYSGYNTIKKSKNNIVYHEIKELVFSASVFQDEFYSSETLDSIIKHELVHYYLFKTEKDAGHTTQFNTICSRIGGDAGYANANIIEQGMKKYHIIICSECHKYVCLRDKTPTKNLMNKNLSICCFAKLQDLGRHPLNLSNLEESAQKIINNTFNIK